MALESRASMQPKEDLDAFLIGVESKLRAPFSSLDLAKAVTTTALQSSSPREYLQMISQVLPRMDKVIQMQVLVGLLGLDPSDATDGIIYDIFTQAQEAPLHEEWVRVVAGLGRGIVFYDGDDDGARKSCRGEEAQSLLDKTCRDILKRLGKQDSTKEMQDMDPLFAPYYFSLLNADILESTLPECLSNSHFQVNPDAELLRIDEKLEQAKAQEEHKEETQKAGRRALGSTGPALPSGSQSAASSLAPVIMPGMRSMTSTATKAKPAVSKTSMFLQAKKPTVGATGGRLGRQLQQSLHARKAGAAQALLAKNRRPGMAQTSGAVTTGSATVNGSVGGRTMKYGNAKSKMKMIDVTEVQGLTREHQERDTKVAQAETHEQKLLARKRKIMEAAAAKGLVATSKLKKNKPNGDGATTETSDGAKEQITQGHNEAVASANIPVASTSAAVGQPNGGLQQTAAAALLAYQQQYGGGDNIVQPMENLPKPTATSADAIPPSTNPIPNKQDWRQLFEKRNKLSMDDQFRVETFFATDRFNPTPENPVYKMKLHEEKSIDAETGMPVKETLYLELDYTTFTFKQLRKIKRSR